VLVRYAMRYGNPSIASELDQLKAEGATRVLIVPAYPQYSGTTTGQRVRRGLHLGSAGAPPSRAAFVNRYHDDPGYIDALARPCATTGCEHGQADQLVMSFHGVPERTLHLGDPYHCECHKTGRLLAERLGLAKDQYKVTFQSRFGKAKWLEPYTEPTLVALAQAARSGGGDLPRLHRRLPGNAGRNRPGSARGLPARGRARALTTSPA
jgi:ferrochelatase